MFNFPFSQQGFLIPVNPSLVDIPIPPIPLDNVWTNNLLQPWTNAGGEAWTNS